MNLFSSFIFLFFPSLPRRCFLFFLVCVFVPFYLNLFLLRAPLSLLLFRVVLVMASSSSSDLSSSSPSSSLYISPELCTCLLHGRYSELPPVFGITSGVGVSSDSRTNTSDNNTNTSKSTVLRVIRRVIILLHICFV